MIVDLHPFAEFSRNECYEYRIGLEGETAALAARNRTAEDLRKLRAAMRALDRAREEKRVGFEEDFSFHMAVAAASGNPFFGAALAGLESSIMEGMLVARTTTGVRTVEKLAAITEQHRAIYIAIASQDEAGAREAMRSHLERCKQSTAHWNIYQSQ